MLLVVRGVSSFWDLNFWGLLAVLSDFGGSKCPERCVHVLS